MVVNATVIPPPAETAPPPPGDHRLGLPSTVALVVGGIVGTGIFGIPAAVASYGWLTVPAFVIVGAGSIAIALAFAQLVRRTDRSGGPVPLRRRRVRAVRRLPGRVDLLDPGLDRARDDLASPAPATSRR